MYRPVLSLIDFVAKSVMIQVKATEQYIPVVLFITLYKLKVVPTFESVDEILM